MPEKRQKQRPLPRPAAPPAGMMPGAVALGAGALLTGFLSLAPVSDGDIWWHLATGRLIAEGGGIPHTDPFTYTAFGRPWVTHEWLSAVLFFQLHRLGGIHLLVLFKAGLAALAVTLGAFAGLAGGRARERLAGAALGVVLAAPLISLRAFVRPHMLTAVLLGVLLLFLRLESTTGQRRWRVALAPLFLLWANLHSGFILGFLLVLLYWAGEAISGRRDRTASSSSPAWRERGLALLLALAASVINPHHVEAHLYPLRLISRADVRGSIVELRNIFHPAYRGAIFLKALAASAAAAGILLFSSRRRLDGAVLLPGIFFGILAVTSIRGLSEFAVILPALLAVHGEALGSRRRLSQAVSAGVLVLVAGIATLAAARGIPIGIDPARRPGLGVETGSCPVSAARLLREAHPSGHVFNLLSSGGYLIHELGPEIQVYIDGRLDVFPPGFLSAYNRMLETGEGWDEAVRRYGITYAVVNHVSRPDLDRGARARLRRDPQWACVLAGDTYLVYARKVPENEAVLRRLALPFDPVSGSPTFIDDFVSGASPQAVAQATGALAEMARLAPEEVSPALLLAQVLDRTGRSAEAAAALRRVVRLDPGAVALRLLLAETLQRADSLSAARNELSRILETDARNVPALSALALVERSEGRLPEASRLLTTAAGIDPADAAVQLRLGVVEAESGNLEAARNHLRRALALRPGDPLVRQSLETVEALAARQRGALPPPGGAGAR